VRPWRRTFVNVLVNHSVKKKEKTGSGQDSPIGAEGSGHCGAVVPV